MKKLEVIAVPGLIGLGLALTATAAPPDAVTQRLSARGLQVAGGADRRQTNGEDGSVTITETAGVTLPGLGRADVSGRIEDSPISKGGVQKATMTVGGQQTSFTYTPATNTITIGSSGGSVNVAQNPDRTYSVDGAAASDGEAAVALLQGKEAWQSANPHAVVLAYSYAQRPNLAAKGDNEAQCQNCAAPPAVCSIFEDFCEAAVSNKAGGGSGGRPGGASSEGASEEGASEEGASEEGASEEGFEEGGD